MKYIYWLLIIILFINCNGQNDNDSVHLNNDTKFPLWYNWQMECSSENPAFYYDGDAGDFDVKLSFEIGGWANSINLKEQMK